MSRDVIGRTCCDFECGDSRRVAVQCDEFHFIRLTDQR